MSVCASDMLSATMTLCEEEVKTSMAELRLLLRIFSKISEAECRRVFRKLISSTREEQDRLPSKVLMALHLAQPEQTKRWPQSSESSLHNHHAAQKRHERLIQSNWFFSCTWRGSPWWPSPKLVGGCAEACVCCRRWKKTGWCVLWKWKRQLWLHNPACIST